jgi:hypothetical protein
VSRKLEGTCGLEGKLIERGGMKVKFGIKKSTPFDRWEDTLIQAGTEDYKQPHRMHSLASMGPNNEKVN